MSDHYNILGVDRTATDAEIKKAFRKLAVIYHPDKCGGNDSKFKKISEAYDILSDPIKRCQYNRGNSNPTGANPDDGDYMFDDDTPFDSHKNKHTHTHGFKFNTHNFGFKNNFDPNFGTNFNFNGSKRSEPSGTSSSGFFKNFMGGFDPFQSFFGNDDNIFNDPDFGNLHNDNTYQQEAEPEPEKIKLHLSLEELYSGGQHEVSYSREIHVDDDSYSIPETTLINIPKGCQPNSVFSLSIKVSEKVSYNAEVIVLAKPHPQYKFKNDTELKSNNDPHNLDLTTTLPIKLKDSLMGIHIVIKEITGENMNIHTNDVIDPREPYYFKGKGFQNESGERGDLYIIFDIKYPERLTSQQKEVIKNTL
jgi:DnaJ-class molecular chaperone